MNNNESRRSFTADEIFGRTPVVEDIKKAPKNGPFRLKLSEFANIWEGHKSKDEIHLLQAVFNADYFDEALFVTDSVSLETLLKQRFYSSSADDGSGFVYIYTFNNSVLAGKFSHGGFFGLFAKNGYKAEIKIGQTTRNIFKRIYEQIEQAKTMVSSPPILLAAFWVPRSGGCERTLHIEFENKRVVGANNKPYRLTGVEWFVDEPQKALDAVWEIVVQHRENNEELVLSEKLDGGEDLQLITSV
jgi:hypothetical protein